MANDPAAAHEALEKAFCFDAPTHEIKIGPDLYLDLPEGYRYALIKQDGHTMYGPTADFLALRILFEDDPTPYESVFSAPFNFTAIGPLKKLDITSGYDVPGVPDMALCDEAINTRRSKREDIKAIRRDHDFYVEYRREATQGNHGKFYHYYITFVAKGTLYTGQAFFNKRTIRGVPVLAKDRDEIVRKFIHMFKTESSENRKSKSVSPGALAECQKTAGRISDGTSSIGKLAGMAAETDTSACEEDSRSSEEHTQKTDMIGEAPCDSHPLTAQEALEKAFCFDASAHEIKIGPDLCFDLPEGYRYVLIKQDGPTPEFQAFRVLFQDDPTPFESVFTAPFSFTVIGPLTKLNIESGYDADAALDGVPIPTRMQPGDIKTIRREDDFYAECRLEETGGNGEAVFRYFVTVVAKGQLYAAQLFFNRETIRGVPVSAKDRDEIVCRFIRMFRTESPENRESEPVSPEAPDECRKIADSISDESSPMEQLADPEPVTTKIDASVCEEDSRFPEEHPKKEVMTGDTPQSKRKVIFTDSKSDELRTYSTLDEICAFRDIIVDDDTVIHLCVGERVRIEGKNPYSIPLNKIVVRFF